MNEPTGQQREARAFRKLRGLAALLTILVGSLLSAGQLPPDIQADRYLLEAEDLIQRQDYAGAAEAMAKIISLRTEFGLELPPEFYFKYAEVLDMSGDAQQALESVGTYLELAGRDGKHYVEALRLMTKVETEFEAAKRRIEAVKREVERLGLDVERLGLDVERLLLEFVRIPPGEFRMGSTGEYSDGDEAPVRLVRISRPFEIGKYEVTQSQWEAIMGSQPSRFSGCGRCPVENVSWEDVQGFLERLNAAADGDGTYRLPTEAEWEYAARGGTQTDTYAGDLSNPGGVDSVLDRIAWYGENSGGRTHPVGGKAPNAYGVHDMLGNVWEWVQDWYGPYSPQMVLDPTGPGAGSRRVERGGGWGSDARYCRSAYRSYDAPRHRSGFLGFRLARTP